MRRRSAARKNKFGCDNAGNPIIEELKDKKTGEVYGEFVENSREVQQQLNEIIDKFVSERDAQAAK